MSAATAVRERADDAPAFEVVSGGICRCSAAPQAHVHAPLPCGSVLPAQQAWNPGIAAVLSLVLPGAGQAYKGQVVNGIAWFLLVFVGYAMLIVPGLVLHAMCVFGAVLGDPSRRLRSVGGAR